MRWIPFIIFTFLCSTVQLGICDVTPNVQMEMSDVGFHRVLQYTVQFSPDMAGKNCEYYLEQTLPAAVYVNVDQLDDIKRLNKLNAIYPKFVDIEISTEKAKSFIVLLHGTPKIKEIIKLPIHFRYHAPSDKRSFVDVDIEKPLMFMRCFDDSLDVNEIEDISVDNYCLHNRQFLLFFFYDNSLSREEVLAGDSSKSCHWKVIEYHFYLRTPLRAQIPIGNSKSYPPILYATIIISWIASIWMVFRTQSISRKINRKLEEQRILKKKK